MKFFPYTSFDKSAYDALFELKKCFNEKSDIDIAVYIKEEYNSFDTKLKIHHVLEISLYKEIDLVVLNNAKKLFFT